MNRPSPLRHLRVSGWRAYAVAVALIAAATAVRWVIAPEVGDYALFPLLTFAVIAAAWLGGLGPGLLATALVLASAYLLFPHALWPPSWRKATTLAFVLSVCGLGSFAVARLRDAIDELRRERRWLANLLESIGDAVLVVDRGWRLSYFNERARDLFGLTDVDTGAALAERLSLWQGGRRFDDVAALQPPYGGGAALPPDLEADAAHGRIGLVGHVAWAPAPPGASNAGYVITMQDVSALRRAHAALHENRALLQAMIDEIPAFVAYVTPERRYAVCNRHLTGLFGGDEALSGRRVREVLGEAFYAEISPLLDAAMRGEAGDGYRTLVGADGQERRIHAHYRPHRDAQERVLGVVVHAYDITERLQREQALAASESRFRRLAEASSAIVWRAGADGRLIEQSGWREFTGEVDCEHMREWARAVHADDGATLDAFLARLLAGTTPAETELRLRAADGQFRYVALRAVPARADAAPGEWIGTTRDVHTRRRAEAALAAAEQELRLILDTMPARIAYIDRERRFRWANRAFLDWNGRSDGVRGERVADVLAGDVARVLSAALDAALRGESMQVEWHQQHPVHGERWTLSTLTPDVTDGDVHGCITLCIDTTEHKTTEEALRRSDSENRALVENLPQMVWIADAAGRVTFFNRRWYEYTGLWQAEAWTQAISPDDRERALPAFREAFDSGRELAIEVRYRRAADAVDRWHLTRAMPIRDAGGRVLRWYGTSYDIDDQKRAQQTLLEAQSRTQEFLSALSHELRNPLAALTTSAHLLTRGDLGGDALADVAATVRRQTAQLQRLVDDLLDVARINEGKIQLRMGEIEIAPMLRDVCADAQARAREADVSLHCRIEGEPLWVHADAARLRQVIDNLMSNALKASPPGGAIVVEATALEAQPLDDAGDDDDGDAPHGHVCIAISDEGVGIEPALLGRMFEPFVQGAQWRSRGLGLGLSIVARMVELHGGRVRASSAGPGSGARFEIELPRIPAPAALDMPAATAGTRRRGRVLIVDDEADHARALRLLLELEGHDVAMCADGETALAQVERERPDVVLSDLGLPEPWSGFELAGELRRRLGARVHLVAFSGYGARRDVARALASGFDAHLIKPSSAEAVAAEIETGLRRLGVDAPAAETQG